MTVIAGFDRSAFPAHGMSTIDWLQQNTNLQWVGYYLLAPDHTGTSWLGTRSELADAGWSIAPIYVGQQDSSNWTRTANQGTIDADQAANEMLTEGFGRGTVVYLDIENGAPLSTGELAYANAWCLELSKDGYTAGIYAPGSVFAQFSSQYPNAQVALRWVASYTNPSYWPPDGTTHFNDPGLGSVHPGATAWQYDAEYGTPGQPNYHPPYNISTVNGPLGVDLDVVANQPPRIAQFAPVTTKHNQPINFSSEMGTSPTANQPTPPIWAYSPSGEIEFYTFEVKSGVGELTYNGTPVIGKIGATPAQVASGVVGFDPGSNPETDTVAILAEDNIGDFSTEFDLPVLITCYCSGARIATQQGDIPIEDLREGDLVLTASGEPKPIVWIGHSRVDCRRHPKPENVIPVRVRAGAFGPDMPKRDLVLSPGHAVFAEGVLIPVCRLVNGVSIVREDGTGEVDYYHLELPEHDVLLAEGLPAESYLDDGNRAAFENGPVRMLHPDYRPQSWENACAPMRESGEEVARVKRHLRERLQAVGYELKEDRQIELWAGGIRLDPQFAAGGLLHFRVPSRCEHLRLVSPRGIPAGFFDESADNRWLGAQLALVLLDGEWIPLDSPILAEGFYSVEEDASGAWRWTNGAATLRLPPAEKPRLLELYVRDIMRGWKAPRQEVASFTTTA